MVRGYQIDQAFSKSLPQVLAVFATSNRRSTFGPCCPVRNVFSRQMKIVRTGLYADGESLRARRSQLRKRCMVARCTMCKRNLYCRHRPVIN